MRKRLRTRIILSCLLLVVLLIVAVSSTKKEPQYKGQSLHVWARLCWSNNTTGEQRKEAADAIRHIGTNSFPFVMQWLRFEPQHWKDKLEYSKPKLSQFLQRFWESNDEGDDKAGDAMSVISVLQSEAVLLAPEILRLSYDKSRDQAAYRALDALGCLGTNGLPQLEQILRDPHHKHRARAAGVIGEIIEMDPTARSAVPALVQCLGENDSILVMRVSDALAGAGVTSDLVIQPLKKNLTSPDILIRRAAETTLRALSPEALTNAPSR